MSVDPDLAETDEPYAYAGDDPVNEADPSGEDDSTPITGSCSDPGFCGDMTLGLKFDDGEWSADIDYDAPKGFGITAVSWVIDATTFGLNAAPAQGVKVYSKANPHGGITVIPRLKCIAEALVAACDPTKWSYELPLYDEDTHTVSPPRNSDLTSTECQSQGGGLQADSVTASASYISGQIYWAIIFEAGEVTPTGVIPLTATWTDIITYTGTEGNITFTERSVSPPGKTKG